MTAPDGTEWTVRCRAEPGGDAEDESEGGEGPRGFWDSPRGWAVSLVAMAAFVGVAFLSPLAAVAIATSLVLAEAVSLVRARHRPWLVEAQASGPTRELAWRVAGRRRAAHAVKEVAAALERGRPEDDPAGATRL